MIRVEPHEGAITVPVRVTPRGGKDCFLPFCDGDEAIRVKVSVPPEDGKANAAVVALFSHALRLPKNRVRLVAGEKSRHKRIALEADGPAKTDALLQALAEALGSQPEACFIPHAPGNCRSGHPHQTGE